MGLGTQTAPTFPPHQFGDTNSSHPWEFWLCLTLGPPRHPHPSDFPSELWNSLQNTRGAGGAAGCALSIRVTVSPFVPFCPSSTAAALRAAQGGELRQQHTCGFPNFHNLASLRDSQLQKSTFSSALFLEGKRSWSGVAVLSRERRRRRECGGFFMPHKQVVVIPYIQGQRKCKNTH